MARWTHTSGRVLEVEDGSTLDALVRSDKGWKQAEQAEPKRRKKTDEAQDK